MSQILTIVGFHSILDGVFTIFSLNKISTTVISRFQIMYHDGVILNS